MSPRVPLAIMTVALGAMTASPTLIQDGESDRFFRVSRASATSRHTIDVPLRAPSGFAGTFPRP